METFSESSYDQWSNEVRAILLYNFLVVNYDSLKFQLQDYFEAALDQEKFIKILTMNRRGRSCSSPSLKSRSRYKSPEKKRTTGSSLNRRKTKFREISLTA